MATAYAANDDEGPEGEGQAAKSELPEVFERAEQRFSRSVFPQLEQRSLALMARRFISIPGAQWEGDFGDIFDNAIKLEVNLARDGLEKIYRDYNESRIVADFRPAGGRGDEESAETLDGLFRADVYCFKSQQAFDNAFLEGAAGGMGAYRLANDWADPYDKESDHQRINPGLLIADADQRVFFDPDSLLYDKSDAKFAFVITAKSREEFEEQYEGAICDWPEPRIDPPYDWFTPETVKIAEYYEVEDKTEKLLILKHKLSDAEQRFWESEIDGNELSEMKKMGWAVKSRTMQRKCVHKYILSGCEVLADKGYVCGDRIPVVPFYGKRSYVDGVERFEGYVQGKMDVQRLYNMAMSKLAETSAQSPRQIPIFAAQQMPPNIATMWQNQLVDRHAYAVVEPLVDPVTGQIITAGPVGAVPPAQIDQATAMVLQTARGDLTYDQQDGADEVKANTSEEAMNVAAARVDAKSGIYIDNWRQTVQCGGEVYLSMAADVYFEPGRTVETMTEDGNDGTATLVQPFVNNQGAFGHLNDFSRGHYKVVVSATETTATRRDRTVKSCLNMVEVFGQLDPEMATAAGITAVSNMDGEGMDDLREYARMKGIQLGLIKPDEDEIAQIQQAQQNQPQTPDLEGELAAAKIAETQASAQDKQTHSILNLAQARAAGSGDATPDSPVETIGKLADAHKDAVQAQQMATETKLLPQKMATERLNAQANLVKAQEAGRLARFKAMFSR